MKNVAFFIIALFSFAQVSFAQQTKYQLSSHILDITTGKPAANVKITLSKMEKDEKWIIVDENITDSNGRIGNFLKHTGKSNGGIYKLTFHTSSYFALLGQKSFYPFIEVVFEITGDEHFHVPITLSAFGYSTYRGS